MAIKLNRPDIRRLGIDVGAEEEGEEDVDEATGGSGLAPGIDDRPPLAPPGDACVLTGGESSGVDDKLENALLCELVDPDDPLPDDAASVVDSALLLPMPPGDACFDGAEKALGENKLEDPPLLLAGCPDVAIGVTIAPCDGWNEGVAVPCVDDDEGEGCSTAPGLVAVLSLAFLLGSVAVFGKGPPGRFLLLSPPPPLPLPPLLPPALNMGPPEAPGSWMRKKTLAPGFQATPVDLQDLKTFENATRLAHVAPAKYRNDVTGRLSQAATQFTP